MFSCQSHGRRFCVERHLRPWGMNYLTLRASNQMLGNISEPKETAMVELWQFDFLAECASTSFSVHLRVVRVHTGERESVTGNIKCPEM